jgi:striatin 1/3/4
VPEQAPQVELSPKITLKSHFDIVRAVHITGNNNTLCSVSEDCMVKLWSLTDLQQKYIDSKGNVEPYLTLRGHTGPLMAATGRDDVLFTAG